MFFTNNDILLDIVVSFYLFNTSSKGFIYYITSSIVYSNAFKSLLNLVGRVTILLNTLRVLAIIDLELLISYYVLTRLTR